MGVGHARVLGACDLRLPIYRQERLRADRNFRKRMFAISQPAGVTGSGPSVRLMRSSEISARPIRQGHLCPSVLASPKTSVIY